MRKKLESSPKLQNNRLNIISLMVTFYFIYHKREKNNENIKKEYTFMAESDSGWRFNENIKRNKNGETYYVRSNHR